MTTNLLPSSALLDEIATSIEVHGRPLYALFTTYTFDAHLFTSQFFPLLCGEYSEDEQNVGLLVVSDARMYKGHRLGPWVTTWPGTELFHPKIALLVFKNATLLFAGSANLTHAGQYEQIEVMGKEKWDRPGLPDGIVPLLSKLNGPFPQALLRLKRLQSKAFACSLSYSFSKRLQRGFPDEIVVVSPFFDSRESAEVDDLGFLTDLVNYHKPNTVKLIVPVEHGTAKKRNPKVQIKSEIIESLKSTLQLYGVDPYETGRPLHAKLVALCRGNKVRLLFGSANATKAGMERKNIEAGWFVETTRQELLRWLRTQGLFKLQLNPEKVCPMEVIHKTTASLRSPLRTARLDEVKRTLTLTWHQPHKVSTTSIFYEKSVCSLKMVLYITLS